MKFTDKILKLNEFLYLNRINNIYSQNTFNQETFKFTVESGESLSSEFKLPLKVKGTFLKEGKPKNRYYSIETLKGIPGNTKLPIPFHYDHKDKEVGTIVGAVTDLKIEGNKGRYFGHVNDEKTARNILDRVITEISVTIFSTPIKNEIYEVEGINAHLTEISFVKDGAEEANTLEIVKGGSNS